MSYDVAIVGAGPAGIAVAKTLDPKLKIILIDKGKKVQDRISITSGFGGAGLYSDGKLIFSKTVGGNIGAYTKSPDLYLEKAAQLFDVDLAETPQMEDEQELIDRAAVEGMELLSTNMRHMGTDGSKIFTEQMYQDLKDKCEVRLETDVLEIDTLADGFDLHVEGPRIYTKYVVLAPGRQGSRWLSHLKNLEVSGNRVDLGIRMEVPDAIAAELVDFSHDFKIRYYTKCFDDMVRTFCVCPHGEVVREQSDSLITCNGHSFKKGKTQNTNFSLLVSIPFGTPINPDDFGRSIVSLANNISDGGVLVQRLGDLLDGRRSTSERISKSVVKPTLDAFPGDLSLVLPYRYLCDLMETIQTMDRIAPGMMSGTNLLYGVEVKFYSNVIQLNDMETVTPNLFCVGDGSGVSRGIVQAAASGIVAAEVINNRSI